MCQNDRVVLDFYKAIINGMGEASLTPFASALNDNDFHISLHDKSYGMHFKIKRPCRMQ